MSFLNILFRRNDNGQMVTIQTTYEVTFAEIALKFLTKTGIDGNDKVIYIYNSEELKIESPKTLAELKIRNGAQILVVMTSMVIGA